MHKLPKRSSAKEHFTREFVPFKSDVPACAGRLSIRSQNHGAGLDKFDRMFAAMAADALTFEPPLALDREDVEVVHYRDRLYGIEVVLPAGFVIPSAYKRIEHERQTA